MELTKEHRAENVKLTSESQSENVCPINEYIIVWTVKDWSNNNLWDCKLFWRYVNKKEEIWPSPMTKAPTPTEMSKGQSDNTNNATKKFD